VILERSCELLVDLRDEREMPIHGARVTVRPTTARPESEELTSGMARQAAVRELEPAGDGIYKIVRLPPRPCELEAVAKGLPRLANSAWCPVAMLSFGHFKGVRAARYRRRRRRHTRGWRTSLGGGGPVR
jgi:hypothetical protein